MEGFRENGKYSIVPRTGRQEDVLCRRSFAYSLPEYLRIPTSGHGTSVHMPECTSVFALKTGPSPYQRDRNCRFRNIFAAPADKAGILVAPVELTGMARRRTTSQEPSEQSEATAQEATTSNTTAAAPAARRRGRPPGATTATNGQTTPSSARRAGTRGAGRPRRARAGGTAETGALIDALLRSRGGHGATQEELRRVVVWADETRREAEAIVEESRPRRAPRGTGKTAGPRSKAAQERQRQEQREREEQLRDRRNRNQTDRALLEGVLAGRVLMDVVEGDIRFLDASAPAVTASAPDSMPS
jgi:hypothetical protein